jgi:hypothetical protein
MATDMHFHARLGSNSLNKFFIGAKVFYKGEKNKTHFTPHTPIFASLAVSGTIKQM